MTIYWAHRMIIITIVMKGSEPEGLNPQKIKSGSLSWKQCILCNTCRHVQNINIILKVYSLLYPHSIWGLGLSTLQFLIYEYLTCSLPISGNWATSVKSMVAQRWCVTSWPCPREVIRWTWPTLDSGRPSCVAVDDPSHWLRPTPRQPTPRRGRG